MATADSMIEMIERRSSCRNYSDAPLEPEVLARIMELLDREHTGPFGNASRFKVLDFSGQGPYGRLGTFGFIRNASLFVAGATHTAPNAALDYGYCLERIVLELTRFGLGTCWLVAYDRSKVAAMFGRRRGETIPAVTPVGYAAGGGRTPMERLVRLTANWHTRKPWPTLFFETTSGLPLSPDDAGPYRKCLESVRLAPSAANRQPWRVYADITAGSFDFYSTRAPGVDLGIAMLHFELAAAELGFSGKWSQDGSTERPGLRYVASWR